MSYTTKEMIQNALKRVNALAGTSAELYHDAGGYSIINKNRKPNTLKFDESIRNGVESLAYLHGIEDTLNFIKEQKEK